MRKRRNRKPIRRALRRPFEWLGIVLGMVILGSLPHRALFALCDFLSAVMYAFDGKGKRLALVNLRVILAKDADNRKLPLVKHPHDPPYQPTRREELIIRRSYRNMARTLGHVFWTSRKAMARAASVAVLSEATRQILADNKPIVTVSAHMGCWEVLSQLVHLEGHKMMSVAKDIGTPAMTELLMKSRKAIGQEIVHADGAFRHLMNGLRNGSDIGLLVDQVVRPEDGGLWVRFFGRPMPVSVAPAFLSAKAKVPVVVAWSRPLKDGTYRCDLLHFYPWRKGVDLWQLTQSCIWDLERVVRRHPSCWVLNYRYFRKVPAAADLAKLDAHELASLA